VVRLSRVTDATTSPARQVEACRQFIEQRGWTEIGVAEDLDISAGSTSPFERPSLAAWIGDGVKDVGRLPEVDVVLCFRIDRLVRRVKHLSRIIEWFDDHNVNLVSATEAHFDLSTAIGRVIAQLVASFAEMELEAMSARASDASRNNIAAGKYRGGVPPWGYVPSDASGEWRLVQDGPQVEVIEEVVRRVLDGEPLRPIAHDLTRREALTPRDSFAQFRDREVKGYGWHPGPLKRALMSPAMLGQVVTREPLVDDKGREVRDAKGKKVYGPEIVVRSRDGSPVVRSDPILSRSVFEKVCAELSQRENRKEPDKRTASLLVQVIHCMAPCSHRRALEDCPEDCMGICGCPAYRLKGGKGRQPRYRCSSATSAEPCGNRSVTVAEADGIVEGMVLALLGSSERMEREWDSGTDYSVELAEVNARLVDLTSQLGSGVFRPGTPQREALDANIAALAARQESLAAEVVKPAGWVWKPTGENFGDWWRQQDTSSRNRWLVSREVWLGFDKAGYQFMPVNLEEWLEGLRAAGSAAIWQKMFKAMKGHGIAGMELLPQAVKLYFTDGGSQVWPMDW
jgi:site-specific DNA recombinase